MKMPKGWKRFKEECSWCPDYDLYEQGPIDEAAELMKEMAETLEKVQAIAEMTMPNGTVTPKPLYDDVTPVLNKFKNWK